MKRIFCLLLCVLLLPGCTAGLGGTPVVEYDPIVVDGQDSVQQAINEYDAETVDYEVWHLCSPGVGSEILYTTPAAPANRGLPEDWLEQLPGEAELTWQQAATRAESLRMALAFPNYEGAAGDTCLWRLLYWPAAFGMAGPRAFYLCLYDPSYYLYHFEGYVSDADFITQTLLFEVPLAFGIDSVTGAVLFMNAQWPWDGAQQQEMDEYLKLCYELYTREDPDAAPAQPPWLQEWTDPDAGAENAAALAEVLGYSGLDWQASVAKRINSTLWAINEEMVMSGEDSLYPTPGANTPANHEATLYAAPNWHLFVERGWFAFSAGIDADCPYSLTFFPSGSRVEFLAEGAFAFGVDHTPFWYPSYDYNTHTWVK